MSLTVALTEPSPTHATIHVKPSNMTGLGIQNENDIPSLTKSNKEKLDVSPKLQTSAKRGPSTPLSPARHQNIIRRKLSPKDTKVSSSEKLLDFEYTKSELIDSKYQNWLLGQFLNNQKDIIKFLELERNFSN